MPNADIVIVRLRSGWPGCGSDLCIARSGSAAGVAVAVKTRPALVRLL